MEFRLNVAFYAFNTKGKLVSRLTSNFKSVECARNYFSGLIDGFRANGKNYSFAAVDAATSEKISYYNMGHLALNSLKMLLSE